MSDHSTANELLPLYAAGTLDEGKREAVEQHLAACRKCRDDLALWRAAAGEISRSNYALAPAADLADRALARIHTAKRRPPAIRRAWHLMLAQVPLVRREIWPASAAVMAIGYAVAALAGQAGVLPALAPLVATACLVGVYGPENDPGLELTLATPTSPWQVLLARLVLVFGYDLVLALAASAALLVVMPELALGQLILEWLGPMAFLSTAALLLSMWIGAGNAIAVAYLAWLARLVAGGVLGQGAAVPVLKTALSGYRAFWGNPLLLLALAAMMGAAALWQAGALDRSPRRDVGPLQGSR